MENKRSGEHITRNSNVEMLRILAMLMIVVGHLFKYWESGIYNITPPLKDPVNSFFLTNVGVDVFILISGYYGIRINIKRIIGLWVTIVFYGFVCAIVNVLVFDKGIVHIAINTLKELSVFASNLWFVRSYFELVLFAPLLDKIFQKSKSTQFQYLIIFLFIDVVLQTAYGGDYRQNILGGALIHFITLYVLARIINLWKVNVSKWWLIIMYSTITILGYFLFDSKIYSGVDSSPWIVVPSVLLLLLFTEFKPVSIKGIDAIAKFSFPVYCLSANLSVIIGTVCSPLLQEVHDNYGVLVYPLAVGLSFIIYLLTIPVDLFGKKISGRIIEAVSSSYNQLDKWLNLKLNR